ncbi:MAG: SGNH/GDSL hydrolase family protein [Nanoarchaeota archaeon]|nr:SGNH/GDSL hydrolase family protein [Nanoarchaeota archaeon]
MKKKKKKSRIAGIMIRLAISLLIFLIVSELMLAIFFPQPTYALLEKRLPKIYQEDDLLPWNLIPNITVTDHSVFNEFKTTMTINEAGFRDDKYEFEIEDDSLRLLCLGDSMTIGLGVEYNETYCYKTGQKIAKETGKRVQVMNAGYASGYTFDSAYLFLREWHDYLKPDFVSYGLYVWNDLEEAQTHRYTYDEEGNLIRIQSNTILINENHQQQYIQANIKYKSLNSIHLFLNKYSNFYVLIKNIFKPTILKHFAANVERNLVYYDNPKNEMHWEYAGTFFKKIDDLCKEKGSEFVIIDIPARHEVDLSRHQTEIIKPYHLEGKDIDIDLPTDRFNEMCNRSEVRCIPAIYEYRRRNDDNDFYFNIDGHINADGHELTAEILSRYLLTQIIQPDDLSGYRVEGPSAMNDLLCENQKTQPYLTACGGWVFGPENIP